MAQIINTNTMSLNAQRNLTTSSNSLATSIQRLSSGLRINSAKDDAAGLAISERFTTQIRGLNQAARNANDGISLAQTAEGALGEVGNNLQRIRELAVQARSATNSSSDRQALNAEVQLLKQEIQRVAEQTTFNGTNLLDGSFTNQAFQIGADQGQTISISQIANANVHKLGSWTTASTSGSTSGVVPNNGKTATTGAFGEFTPSAATTPFKLDVGGLTLIDAPDASGVDGATLQAEIDAKASVLDDAGITVSGSVATGDLAFTKADGETLNVTMSTAAAATFANASVVQGPHTAGSYNPTSFLLSGSMGEVTINLDPAKNASERATQMVNAVNAKTHQTGVTAALVDGKLQLTDKEGNVSVATTGTTDAATLTKETGLSEGASTNYAAGVAATGFADLDISSQENADNAILAMDAALNSINSARADLGAIQNRFTSTIANLNTTSENLSAARSRIRDVDYAQETAELTRGQILQQAGTAMLAQANQVPQNVLRLLQS